MLDKTKIYHCDLDGVLADFNIEPNGVERFRTEKGFFKNLKPIRRNLRAIKQMIRDGYIVKIISASPNKSADKDKREWLKFYLNEMPKKNIILCRNGEVKANFIKDIENSVLFDDYGLNCREWRASGGTAFKVRDDKMLLEMVGL